MQQSQYLRRWWTDLCEQTTDDSVFFRLICALFLPFCKREEGGKRMRWIVFTTTTSSCWCSSKSLASPKGGGDIKTKQKNSGQKMIGYCGLQMKCSKVKWRKKKQKKWESSVFSAKEMHGSASFWRVKVKKIEREREREKMEDFDRIFSCGCSSSSINNRQQLQYRQSRSSI